jgi:hypothetical protein
VRLIIAGREMQKTDVENAGVEGGALDGLIIFPLS